MNKEYSVSPDGEKFPLPEKNAYAQEYKRLKAEVAKQRKLKREIVVVMGVGFVGVAMAAVIADTVDKKGKS
ncbi:MAG TPA: GDP-mannose dehydrogenase, partial [Nitrospirae bacterium]|nr:GDP-mannose dehydrogenase [Nitrospirota bacterium]HEW80791.1 GDP-mannose dehydrogenase [Nitrospirota bacterium]